MTPSKETNKAPINDPKEMKLNELPDKCFRIIFIQNSVNYNKTQTKLVKQWMKKMRGSTKKQWPLKTNRNPSIAEHND